MTDPDDGQKWPKALTEEDGKLYRNGKLLVPESRVLELCEAWHRNMMHPGVKNQALDMQRPFEIDQISLYSAINEAGSDPRGHLWVTWGVYLCAGKPPLADIILSHPPDLTRCDSVIGLAIPAMSGHIQ